MTSSDGNMEPTPSALAGDSQPLKGRPTDSPLWRRVRTLPLLVMSHQKLKKGAGRGAWKGEGPTWHPQETRFSESRPFKSRGCTEVQELEEDP